MTKEELKSFALVDGRRGYSLCCTTIGRKASRGCNRTTRGMCIQILQNKC